MDQGGYFTFDASFIPDSPGHVELVVTIEYTDDFNRTRTLTDNLNVTVEAAMVEPIGGPDIGKGQVPVPGGETFLQKAWRFILGLFGLDSAAPAGTPSEPVPSQGQPVQIPRGSVGTRG